MPPAIIAALVAMAAAVLATAAGFVVLCVRVADIHRRTTQGWGQLARLFGENGARLAGVELPWKMRFAFWVGEHYALVLFGLVIAFIAALAVFAAAGWAVWQRQVWVRGLAIGAAALSFGELAASPAFIPAIVIGSVAAALLWAPGTTAWFAAAEVPSGGPASASTIPTGPTSPAPYGGYAGQLVDQTGRPYQPQPPDNATPWADGGSAPWWNGDGTAYQPNQQGFGLPPASGTPPEDPPIMYGPQR